MQYTKNLIPSFYDNQWTMFSGIQVLSPTKLVLNGGGNWDVSKISVPVTPGKPFTLSADITGVATVEVWEDGTINMGSFSKDVNVAGGFAARTYTPTRYTAEIRIVNSTKGYDKSIIENLQLEQSDKRTSFSPYELGMKKDAYKKDVVYPGISGSSHSATAANVYSVKDDVTVGKCQVSIATTGTFKVAIYEWVDGSGRIGDPIYQKDTVYDSTGVFTYDFGGVHLKAGKNYWIGRYEDTNNAAANRTLGADGIKGTYKHVDWLGGTSLTSSSMAYPTTYYYFYGLEFEAVDLKKAKLLSERNLMPDFNDPRWSYDKKLSVNGTSMKVDPDNPHRGTLTVGVSAQAWLIQVPVKSGVTYTFQFGNITGLYRLLKGWTDSYNNVPIVGQDNKVLTFTPDDTWGGYVTVRLTHGAAGDYRFEDLLLVEGNYSTVQQFTPYNPVKLKSDKLISENGALNVPMSDDRWTIRAGTTYKRVEGKRVYWDSNQDYAGIQQLFSNIGLDDSLFQGKEITFGGKTHPMATVMLFYRKSDGNPAYIGLAKYETERTFTLPYGISEMRIYVQSDVGGRGELWAEDVYLKFGSNITYKPYEPVMKPAILYPKKNLIPPFTDSSWSIVGESTTSVLSETKLQTATVSGINSVIVPVKGNTQYTFSAINNDAGIYFIDAYRGDVNLLRHTQPAGNTDSSITFTTPATANAVKIILRGPGSASKSALWEKLQLESGSKTAFEAYQLSMKQ